MDSSALTAGQQSRRIGENGLRAGSVPGKFDGMNRGMIALLAFTCGVTVGNVYFPQAISPLVAEGLGVPPDRAALVVTAAQIGYSVGIVALVPLGDRLPYRPLIVGMFAVTGAGLLVAASAPSLPPLFGAGVAVGVATVIAPIIGAMVAGMVPADRRGAVSGTMLAGSTGGMLLARTFSGGLGEWLGWRAPYLAAAALAALMAIAMAVTLPRTRPHTHQPYPRLMAEPLRLWRTEPELRRSCLYQAAIFGGFSAVWASVALLLTGPVYGFGAQSVGLLALVNAATMVCTPLAGRWVDRLGPDPVNLVCMLAVVVAAGMLIFGAVGGITGLAALVIATLVLDVAMQCGHVANTVRNYALHADARARVTTAYMTCAYVGGALGSWLGVRAYAQFGWHGVGALVALLAGVALVRHSTRAPAPSGCRAP